MVERNLERRQNEMNEREKKEKRKSNSFSYNYNKYKKDKHLYTNTRETKLDEVCVLLFVGRVFFLLLLLFVVGFYLIYTKI